MSPARGRVQAQPRLSVRDSSLALCSRSSSSSSVRPAEGPGTAVAPVQPALVGAADLGPQLQPVPGEALVQIGRLLACVLWRASCESTGLTTTADADGVRASLLLTPRQPCVAAHAVRLPDQAVLHHGGCATYGRRPVHAQRLPAAQHQVRLVASQRSLAWQQLDGPAGLRGQSAEPVHRSNGRMSSPRLPLMQL